MAARYWATSAVLAVVVIVVVIAVFILKGGNTLAPTSTARRPLDFTVVPVTPVTGPPTVIPDTRPPTVSPGCPLTGYVGVRQSQISGVLQLGKKTTVKSVVIRVRSTRSLSQSAYEACASTSPAIASNPQGLPVVRLSTVGDAGVPGLDDGGVVDLIVRPPAGRTAGAIAYTWQITVNYANSHYGPGSDSRGPFTLLAPAS